MIMKKQKVSLGIDSTLLSFGNWQLNGGLKVIELKVSCFYLVN